MRSKPLLKWPGGKQWIAPFLANLLRPRLSGLYYEPFLGGGAVFLALAPPQAMLSDINGELVAFLKTLSCDVEKVVAAVWKYSNTAACYYGVRKAAPRTAVGAAARFLYLNRTCWGGIYRLNRRGAFNGPFGNSERVICHFQEAAEAAKAFQGAHIDCLDFEHAMRLSVAGDVVYCDPPYSFEGSNGFVRYNDRLFSKTDHERLAACAQTAVARGASVAVSALYDKNLFELYRGWWCLEARRVSRVSRIASGRRLVEEVVLFSWLPEVDKGVIRVV